MFSGGGMSIFHLLVTSGLDLKQVVMLEKGGSFIAGERHVLDFGRLATYGRAPPNYIILEWKKEALARDSLCWHYYLVTVAGLAMLFV